MLRRRTRLSTCPPTTSEYKRPTVGLGLLRHPGGSRSRSAESPSGSLARTPTRTPYEVVERPTAHPRRSSASSQVELQRSRGRVIALPPESANRARAFVPPVPSPKAYPGAPIVSGFGSGPWLAARVGDVARRRQV